MAVRVESFSYNALVIGGAAQQATTEILDRFGFDEDESTEGCAATFVCRFIYKATTSALLNSGAQTMLASLRTPNAALTVDWATNVMTFDPAVGVSTGFLQAPSVEKDRDHPGNTPLSRVFTFRCRVQLPPNYTGAAGRRASSVNLHYDVDQRRVVTISGLYTQIPALTSRAALLAAIDAFATTRLALVAAGAVWVVTRRDEPDDNFQATCSFSRDYAEVAAGGRRGSTITPGKGPGGLRMITIQGTYYRTKTAEGGGADVAASVNYAHATTGGLAYAVIQLAALTTAQGGALTVGTNCELHSETATPNEQDDRVDYTLVYRELIFTQSRASTPGFDDPEIFDDSITFIAIRNPLDDSPIPPPGGSGQGAVAQPSVPIAQPGGGSTVSPPAPGGSGGNPGTVSPPNVANGSNGSTGGTTQAQKPVDLWIRYKAIISKGVLSLRAKWEADILPFLVQRFPTQLGFPPAVLIAEEHDFVETTNEITATVHAQALPGDVIAFKISMTTNRHLGLNHDGTFNGQADNYLLQQELPAGTARRTVTAMWKSGGSFKLAPGCPLETRSQVPGYIVMDRSYADVVDKIVGVPGLGIATQPLSGGAMIEDLLFASSLIAGSTDPAGGKTPTGGAGGSGGGAPVATGSPSQAGGVPVATGGGSTVSPP